MAFREVLPYLSLEPFRRCWYTQFLVALKESALPAPAGPTDVVYRFLYLPTFRPAISVRIERRDSIRMTVSQTEGWGGYYPRGLAWTRTVRLPLPAWDSLELALAAAHFWSDTVPEGPGGLDGSRWISGGRPDRPACSSRSLEPARSRSRRGLLPGGQLSRIARTSRQTRATEGAI